MWEYFGVRAVWNVGVLRCQSSQMSEYFGVRVVECGCTDGGGTFPIPDACLHLQTETVKALLRSRHCLFLPANSPDESSTQAGPS